VPQLVIAVKSETDESKRASAAKELRDYDAAAYPDIVPVLIDVLQHDPKAGVRSEAVQSLAKLRPLSSEVGTALEEATRDPSFRVRWQARSSLMSYRMSGYHGTPKPSEAVPSNAAPPANAASSSVRRFPPQLVSPARSYRPAGETAPPPLAQQPPSPMTLTVQPQMPPALTPSATPQLRKPPPSTPPSDQGPDLPPPQ
jgi:hypothetical protein